MPWRPKPCNVPTCTGQPRGAVERRHGDGRAPGTAAMKAARRFDPTTDQRGGGAALVLVLRGPAWSAAGCLQSASRKATILAGFGLC